MCSSADNAPEPDGDGGRDAIFEQVVTDNNFIECVYYIVRLYKQKNLC